MVAWESFGEGWVTDVVKQLKLDDVRKITAPYGELPDLSTIDFDRDVVFTWNGTTSGVRVPNGDFIPADPQGPDHLRRHVGGVCAGSRFRQARCRHLLLAEGAGRRGRPRRADPQPPRRRAARKLHAAWPLPKIFRMTKGGKLIEGIFVGETINTPSMLCVEDYLDALTWAKSLGGLKGLIARADANAGVLHRFVADNDWIENLAKVEETRSNTSVCLVIADPDIGALPADAQAAFAKAMVTKRLDTEGVALDIGAYRDAPAGLRIWCGATVETFRSRGADAVALLGLRPGERLRSSRPPDQTPRGRRRPPRGPAPRFPDSDHQWRPSWHLAYSYPTPCRKPPSRSSAIAALTWISCRSSARTRKSCSKSSASMTASPSARPPRRPRS
jgi:phosphoserine aminotransferase